MRSEWSLRAAERDAATVFAVVADVERYPEFLPGVRSARILKRDGGRWAVDNVFGVGLLQSRFLSIAEARPPEALTIVSNDGPWRDLFICWRVKQDGPSCVLSCEAEMEFRSPALNLLAKASLAGVERLVIAAFERRLNSLSKARGNDE